VVESADFDAYAGAAHHRLDQSRAALRHGWRLMLGSCRAQSEVLRARFVLV
jgi:hypothetical protein